MLSFKQPKTLHIKHTLHRLQLPHKHCQHPSPVSIKYFSLPIYTRFSSTLETGPTTTAAQSTYETTAIPYTHMITTVTAESTPLTENPTTLTTGTGSTTHITVGTEMPTTPATVTETTTSITLGPNTTPTPATGTDTTTFVTDGTEAKRANKISKSKTLHH
ncbi:unnamed protein product, partial [Rotaria magnacalcarata]